MLQASDFNEQSLSIMKEQTTKLKVQGRDLELKDQQIRFLKQTILALEQQKDTLAHHNHQLKMKLKTMANQITNYNTNVVQKIYQQNQELLQSATQLKSNYQELTKERDLKQRKLVELEKVLEQQLKIKEELMLNNDALKEFKSKNQKKMNMLEKQNKQLLQKNISLQRQVDEGSNQMTYCSQQVDILTQKHQDALKHNEKKLKNTIQKMVNKQEFERVQKELKDSHVRNSKILKQVEKKQKQNEKNKLEILAYKQKLLTLELNQETNSLQLKTDIINLSQSIKIAKKIAQFESQEHERIDIIYDSYKQVVESNQKIKKKLQNAQDKNRSLETDLKITQQTLKIVQIQLGTLRERRQQEKQSLQAEYENKLMEISIRLRKQEVALTNLRNKQSAFDQLQEQYQHDQQEHKLERETLNRTIEQLSKENGKLSQQLSQAVRLCEQNMLNKECIIYYKYSLQDIIGVVYYLYQLLLSKRQLTKRLLIPFVNQYWEVHQDNKKEKKKRKPIGIFRSAVWMIIAISRMQKQAISGKGLQRYAFCAIERRYKIQNLSTHIQKISNCILKGSKVPEILKESQSIYKWKLPEYQKVILNKEGK